MSPKPESLLQQKFAALCAHQRFLDLRAHLLLLALTVSTYAFFLALFDFFLGNSSAPWIPILRWISYAGFVLLSFFLTLRILRCAFTPINPYYVAQQLEQTLPNAKNSLINWLDLHDEDLPVAFQKNLTANAVLQFEESDIEQTLPQRRNWLMLSALAVPSMGLVILLLLGPFAFLASMMRAFIPFIETPYTSRTQITLVQPQEGDAEVPPAQAVAFAVKIEGRIPANHRDDAPRLQYRYQEDEDDLTQRLQHEGNGIWTTQLRPEQVRGGFIYRISAGDASTPAYRIRVRARMYVKQFTLTYLHRPYRHLPKTTYTFPNESSSVPVIHGPRGTEVELIVHASRPVKNAGVEIVTPTKKIEVSGHKLPNDPHAFAFRWKLTEPAKFRVVCTATDGEENADRNLYDISVFDDAFPAVVITRPGLHEKIVENGTVLIEGRASNDFGLKALSLHVRVASGPTRPKLQAKPYRDGKSFQFADGTFPNVIEYADFLALDQLKNEQGTLILLPAGTVLEYWLEATDSADFPQPTGNVGKSSVQQITLIPALKNPQQQQAERKQAESQLKQHAKKQDEQFSREGARHKPDQQEEKTPDEGLDKQKEQIEKALQKEEQGPQGNANAENKPGPQPNDQGPQPEKKEGGPKEPEDAGKNKQQGKDNEGSGSAKGKDAPQEGSKGESKEGPKDSSTAAKEAGATGTQEPAANAKDGGPMGKNAPEPAAKGDAVGEGAPQPQTKQDHGGAEGSAKGGEPNGPERATKNEPSWNDLAKMIEQLGQPGGAGKKLADVAKESQDERKREFAKEVLDKNLRDPNTGEPLPTKLDAAKNGKEPSDTKKGPNPYGSLGLSQGVSDEAKAAAANRDFLRRIGQMQLSNWKKRMTPELLKKMGMSQADWQRFVRDMQAYDARVRQLNARLAKKGSLSGGRPPTSAQLRQLESTATSKDPLEGGTALPPPDLLEAQRRFLKSGP